MTFAVGEAWTDENDYEIVWGREYRYDAARARYVESVLDVVKLNLDEFDGDETWSQYDGDVIYADHTVDGEDVTVTRWYEPGIGLVEDVDSTPLVKYYHTDLIGTTRMMSNAAGAGVSHFEYTAFGEQVSGTTHRYGYAGAHGYQTDETGAFPYQHVGARYYDPATGRFLQRDPIGISDGTNVYTYVRSAPTDAIDFDGTGRHKLRDAKTGRFKKRPWWRRAGKWGMKRIPVYWISCKVAEVGHRIARRPYEDPHDIVWDTVENLYTYAKNTYRNRRRRRRIRRPFSRVQHESNQMSGYRGGALS